MRYPKKEGVTEKRKSELFGRDLIEPVFIVRQLRVDSGRIAVPQLFTE